MEYILECILVKLANVLETKGDNVVMEVPRYWRGNKLRLGNSEAWQLVVERYLENNPHLSLGALASGNLSVRDRRNIHERLKQGEVVR